ncbi:podoplanin isoform 1-T1 [Hipposideros larvatus]
MWKVPVLLLVLGRASLWLVAGAPTFPPEDDIVTPGAEDSTVTPGASEEPYGTAGSTAVVPTSTKSIRIEDLPTSESTVHAQEESQSTTTVYVATSHSFEGTQTTVEKDGLATGTLIGIIVGVLLAIGFIGGIIIVAVRKISGRYSP